MAEKLVLRVGDMVECSISGKAVIEKIRMISTSEYREQHRHDGDGDDVVLTLRDAVGLFNYWLRDNPIRVLEDNRESKDKKGKKGKR